MRWTGKLKPAFLRTYAFYTTSDDAVPLLPFRPGRERNRASKPANVR